jgi:hypothetical protein
MRKLTAYLVSLDRSHEFTDSMIDAVRPDLERLRIDVTEVKR